MHENDHVPSALAHPRRAPGLPVDATAVPRYAGEGTFARLPRFADLPAPTPSCGGCRSTPASATAPAPVSARARPPVLAPAAPLQPGLDASPFERRTVADAGDVGLNPFDLQEAIDTVHAAARELSGTGRTLLTIGGDHTIALPLLRNLHAMHGPIAVLHFDAHLDTWDTYFGAPYTHGTPFRRAAEEGLVDFEHSAHVGIRGPLYSSLDLQESASLGFTAVNARDFVRRPLDDIISEVRTRLGERPVYVSLDIDVLDPAFAPGTGTPEAGGLTSAQLLEVLRGLDGLDVVGADVVEVSPAYDHAEITGIAAAHVLYELLSVLPRPRR